MTVYKPAASPHCWGAKYQDGDKECEQCKYNDSCRVAMLERIVAPSESRTSLPVLRTYAPPPVPSPPSSYQVQQPVQTSAMVPLPPRPYYPPPPASIPLPKVPSLPATQVSQPTAPQATQYYQQSTGFSLPNPHNPNPMAAMHRPGAPSPAYYFTQYPGESVAKRVGKNIVLRACEAIFGELMQFFRHWTWPPR